MRQEFQKLGNYLPVIKQKLAGKWGVFNIVSNRPKAEEFLNVDVQWLFDHIDDLEDQISDLKDRLEEYHFWGPS